MREFKVPVQKYTIFTQLGKAPQEYPNAGSMPSVQVALRQMAKGKHIKAKDVMSFIITGESSGSAESAAKNAYPVEDVLKQDSELKPDIDYYLHKQILPPVERLCAPISGTNITHLADCLGLDTSKYRVSTAAGNSNANEAGIQPLESLTSAATLSRMQDRFHIPWPGLAFRHGKERSSSFSRGLSMPKHKLQ
jgi:DNA polymerase alpha subunit A